MPSGVLSTIYLGTRALQQLKETNVLEDTGMKGTKLLGDDFFKDIGRLIHKVLSLK